MKRRIYHGGEEEDTEVTEKYKRRGKREESKI